MLTIFALPKKFEGHINIIQKNAIKSWLKLSPRPQIILLGDDEGTAQAAGEFGLLHIREIKKNKTGTPLVNDIFEKAQQNSQYNVLAYVNSDIILMQDFMEMIKRINFSRYLVVGRRWDLDLKEEIDFNNNTWPEELKKKTKEQGELHGPAGIDYFVFPKGLFGQIPAFAIGRTVWDNWFLHRAWVSGAKLIDTTETVQIVHQNHHYGSPKGKAGIWKGPEAKENLRLAGGSGHMLTIRDAELAWTMAGIKKPRLTPYRILSFPFRYFEKYSLLRPILFLGWLPFVLWRKLYKLLFL